MRVEVDGEEYRPGLCISAVYHAPGVYISDQFLKLN